MPEERQTPESTPGKNNVPLSIPAPLLEGPESPAILNVHIPAPKRHVHCGNIHAAEVARSKRFRASAILNPAEAARFLGGLNARTVTRWAREGYLPAIPVGEGKRRLWRFRAGDLERWMLSRRTGTLRTAAGAPNGGFVR